MPHDDIPSLNAKEARVAADATVRYYNRNAATWTASQEPLWVDERLWAFRGLIPSHDPLLLDIGCGAGRAVPLFETIGIHRIIGVDAAGQLLGIGRRLYPNVDFRIGKVQRLEKIVPEKCDAFFCAALLHHIPKDDLQATLNSMRSVLVDGAVGIIITMIGTGTITLTHANAEHIPPGDSVLVQTYEYEDLEPLLKEAGFEVIDGFEQEVMLHLMVRAI